MQIVIPMAGIGKRFLDAGYREPKPLIKVDGKSMIEHIVNLFQTEDNFIFIVNDVHEKKYNLSKELNSLRPGSKVLTVLYEKLGPVWDTLKAKEYINTDEPTVVTYCDFNMYWDYDRFKKTVESEDVDGAVISYTGFHPHLYGPNKYAGVKVGKENIIEEVKEKHSYTKDKMKSWHSNGTYYFKSGAMVLKYFSDLVNKKETHDNGEYYVSQVYNKMIEDKLKVVAYPIDHFCQWGTPEDLEQYLIWQSGLDTKELNKKLPHISPTGHQQALNYWKEFNNKRKL